MTRNIHLLLSVIVCAAILIVIWSLFGGKRQAHDRGAFLKSEFFNNLNPASPVVATFIAISGLSGFFHFPADVALIASTSLGIAFVEHSLSLAINARPFERSCALFALIILDSSFCPPALTEYFAFGSIMGLCLSKLMEIRRNSSPVPVQDIIPACVWLAGLISFRTVVPGLAYPDGRELLALFICTTFLLRLFQPPFLFVDHLFVKRIALALTGGMVMFVVIVKYFYLPSLGKLSCLFTLGYFLAYLAERIDTISARDNKRYKAIFRSGLLVFASVVALFFQSLAAPFGVNSLLFLAGAMFVAESSFTAGMAGLYFIAVTVMSRLHVNAETASYYWLEGNLGTMYPVIGGAFSLVGLAIAVYLVTGMPERNRVRFDWAQMLAFVSMIALLIVSILPPPSAYQFLAVVVNMVLVMSIWREVFLPGSKSPASQGILLMVNLVCLTCLLSHPGAFLLSSGIIGILYRAWPMGSSEADPISPS